MFRGLAFYLAPTLSSEEKAGLKRLIKQNGGVVSDTPKGATQLVAYDKLDARHATRIATDFIKDSVAFRALQDPAKYSSKIFTTELTQRKHQKRGERVQYTLEDDARMLHFARMRDWKAMGSVPLSAWEVAETEGVTSHSAQSMRERFRKQLMAKTPVEQRILLAKAAATTRAQLLEQEHEEEEEEEEDEQEMEMQEPPMTEPSRSATPEAVATDAKEVAGHKLGRRSTRSRKQTTPLQIAQRIRASEGDSNEGVTSPVPVSTSPPSSVTRAELAAATPTTPASQSTSGVSGRSDPSTDDQRTKKQQQKRKRDTPRSVISSQESRSSAQETVESDSEGGRRQIGGIYFTSAWTTTVTDRSKRRLLQQFFESPSRAESVASEQIDDVPSTAHEEDYSSTNSSRPPQPRVQEPTEGETDVIICQLQLDTHQDLQSVVHALYYFSGDVEKAKRFLKGASPSDMWCPEDDLLLTNLVAEERTDLSSVDEALARGDFASLQEPDAVLKRVQFLK